MKDLLGNVARSFAKFTQSNTEVLSMTTFDSGKTSEGQNT